MSLYERAAILPGRSMTCSKAPGRFMPIEQGPLFCDGGDGSLIYGSDGKNYIDMLCALGAISLGYGCSDREWPSHGVYSLPHEREVEAAESVLEHVAPWASWVKFTKTGSESTHAAYRIAKKVTGRDIVLAGNWAYHGWHEWCSPAAEMFSHGADLDEIGDWNDTAAVFIEPHRWEHVDQGWLREVRAFCDRVGALLVFDSMIYGGRFHLQGTSGFFGIEPDLECYGKAYGNGASVAFVTGKAATYEAAQVASGTYSGDVTGLSAVCDTLAVYTSEPVIDTLWARGRQLQEGLKAIVPPEIGACEGAPVHQRIQFINSEHSIRFASEMAKRGVLWHRDVTNIMYAHTEAIIDQVLEAARESVAAL
jgi:glutamate-1-semialdehyde 2,1-aminomutase